MNYSQKNKNNCKYWLINRNILYIYIYNAFWTEVDAIAANDEHSSQRVKSEYKTYQS